MTNLWFPASAGFSGLLGDIYLLFLPFPPQFTHNSYMLSSSPASWGRRVRFLFQANLFVWTYHLPSPEPVFFLLLPLFAIQGSYSPVVSSQLAIKWKSTKIKQTQILPLPSLFPASPATSFLSPPLLGNLQAHVPVIPRPPALWLLSHPSWVLQWPLNYQIQRPHFSPPLGIKTMLTDLFS